MAEDLGFCESDMIKEEKSEVNESQLNIEKESVDKLSHRAKFVRSMVSEFNKNSFLKNHFVAGVRSVSEFDKAYKYPDQYTATRIDMENFPMELLELNGSDSPWVILQLHGGGYVGAFKNNYRNMAKFYSEAGKGAKVLTIDYRVAPEHVFPAALDDALCAYEWLLENGYTEENIILAGDSAGGGLAMALCHYLKDRGKMLPKAIIGFSPWTDLTASGSSYTENVDKDPIFGHSKEDIISKSSYIGDDEATNPYISPLFGEFEGFPPMLIQAGTHEMLLSDSSSVAEKAKAAGVDVTFTIYEGMFHVFQMVGYLIPESKKAWSQVGEFIDNLT